MIAYFRIFTLVIFIGMLIPVHYNAQDKLRPRLSFSYLKDGNAERYLKVKAIARIDRKSTPITRVPLKFYFIEISEENFLGTAETDMDGVAQLLLPDKFYDLSKGKTEFKFITVLEDQDNYRDVDSDITVYESALELDLTEEDGEKIVKARLFRIDSSGAKTPVEDAEVKILVARPFGPLPISEAGEVTDENGALSTVFPDDLPGDETGKVNIIASLEDSDEFGSVRTNQDIIWGLEAEFDDKTLKRSLWAAGANAPLGLLFFVNSLIIATWGIIFYIIYQIFLISKHK